MHRFRTCLYFCHSSFDPDVLRWTVSFSSSINVNLISNVIHPFGLLEQRRTFRLGTNGRIVRTHMSYQTCRQAMSMFVVPWMAVKRGAWLRALSMPGQSAREKSSISISVGQGFVHGSVVSTVTPQWSDIGSVMLTSLARSGRVVCRSIVLLLWKSFEKRVGFFTHCERPKSSNNWNSRVPAEFVWESQVLCFALKSAKSVR